MTTISSRAFHVAVFLVWILILAFFFANVEIQIEGSAGWAANLPTWRVDGHPLLNVFWGGKTLTGYHFWVFSFMALAFHLPVFVAGQFSLRMEARILGGIMLFWILEDALWFVLNPAFGLSRLSPEFVPWHKHWLGGWPVDYFVFAAIGAALVAYSFAPKKTTGGPDESVDSSRVGRGGA